MWVEVFWFGAWERAWLVSRETDGVMAQIAEDAPARFFPNGSVREVQSNAQSPTGHREEAGKIVP